MIPERFEQIINLRVNVKDIKKKANNGTNDDISNNLATKPEFDFIIPKPSNGENKQSYISRCMKVIGKEYDTPAQALAVCYSQIEPKKNMKDANPCWKGYEQVGTKMLHGKEVPNCVPVKK